MSVRSTLLKNVGRVVVKVGTGVLTDTHRRPDFLQMVQLAAQLAELCRGGKEVVLVTSGAVGAGMGVLGYDRRPGRLAELQACAAVGQSRLMATYEEIFGKLGLHVAQVLLTHDDLEHHERHLNARNTLVTLLERGVLPIINENDAVSFTEIKVGDNDRLSALVACLLPADLLIILTSVEGLMDNYGTANARVVPTIEKIDASVEHIAQQTSSPTAVGGMISKVEAAKMAVRAGIPMVIASGRKRDVLARVINAEPEGTLFVPQPKKLKGRKRWIAFFHHPTGALFVDDGAKRALRERGKSLLAPGVTRCEGEFDAGDVIRICDADGTEFARGIVSCSAAVMRQSDQRPSEIVHRDNLVIL